MINVESPCDSRHPYYVMWGLSNRSGTLHSMYPKKENALYKNVQQQWVSYDMYAVEETQSKSLAGQKLSG